MKVNFIIQGFPESVVIDGGEYPINWDFRVWMQFEDIMNSDISDSDKLYRLLRLYFLKIPANLYGAVEQMLWFYCLIF